jgi:hypothetical protein
LGGDAEELEQVVYSRVAYCCLYVSSGRRRRAYMCDDCRCR